MAKTKISEFSTTAADNTDITNINIAEGCSPANVNNAIRSLMSVLKNFEDGSSGDSVVVGGNLSVTGTTTLVGTAIAPTPSPGDNSTKIATTAFVQTKVGTLGTMASQNATAVAITGGTITGITDLTVADGGTGASSITANSVVLGNGTSALSGNLVAPSTSGNVLTSNGTTWISSAPTLITLTASQVTTSGNTVTITGIPSTAIRVTVLLNGVSTNGSSVPVVRVGNSSGLISSGYVGVNGYGFAAGTLQNSSGFSVSDNYSASSTIYGTITISKFDSSNWSMTGNLAVGTNKLTTGSSFVSVSGSLDRVAIVTSDTFNGGSIAVIYE
jgi:hypothetical protein